MTVRLSHWTLLCVKFVTLAAITLPLGCSKKTGIVPRGPHRPESEPIPLRVKLRPPPIKIEVLPLRRNKECFFRDGYWSPRANTWEWTNGAWVLPPDNCYYAPPYTRYEELEVGSALVHRPGAWLKYNEATVCPAPLPCPPPKGRN